MVQFHKCETVEDRVKGHLLKGLKGNGVGERTVEH